MYFYDNIVKMEQTPTTTSLLNQSIIQNEIIKNLINSSAFWYAVAFVIIATIFIFVFKKQIGERISNIRRVGLGKNTIDMETTGKEENKKEEQVSEKKYEEEKKATEKKEEDFIPQTLEEWREKMMFDFVFDRNKETILYFKLSHTLGNTSAILELKKYLDDMDIAYGVNMALGFCYSSSDDFDSAAPFFTKAFDIASSDDEISLTSTHYSSS